MDQPASLGRIVHYNIRDGYGNPAQRSALIIKVWNSTLVNLKVFAEDLNEWDNIVTSVPYGTDKFTWSWPPRV